MGDWRWLNSLVCRATACLRQTCQSRELGQSSKCGCTSHPVVCILRLLCYQFGFGSVACSKTLPFHTCNDSYGLATTLHVIGSNGTCSFSGFMRFCHHCDCCTNGAFTRHGQCSHAHFFVVVAMDQDWSNAKTIIFNNIWRKLWFRRWF